MDTGSGDITPTLKARNYFRLSGYWFPMRDLRQARSGVGAAGRELRHDSFTAGHRFQEVDDIYRWDATLRSHLFEGISRVEVALRSQVAYVLSAHDPMAHRNPEVFNPKFSAKPKFSAQVMTLIRKRRRRRSDYEQWVLTLNQAIAREQNADDAISHQIDEFGDVHIWALVEIIEFLPTIKAFKAMRQPDRQIVSSYFGMAEPPTLISILEALNNLRNKTAHHARIWNRNFSRSPALPSAKKYPYFESIPRGNNSWQKYRLYPLLCSLVYLLEHVENDRVWTNRLIEIIDAYPVIPGYTLHAAGFPDDWRDLPAWATSTGSTP